MVVESVNLGIHLYQADASQQVQNLFLAAERANQQGAADQTKDRAKAELNDQVQDPAQVENDGIQGESRGAHSHTREEKKEEAEEKPDPPKEPPDPRGRGQRLDITG